MALQDGNIYRAPDGQLFKAILERRRYADEPAWVFRPTDMAEGGSLLDSLEKLLFLENGRIGYFEFSGMRPNFTDTGWTTDDFTPHISNWDTTFRESSPS
jgi:hypothetical protein